MGMRGALAKAQARIAELARLIVRRRADLHYFHEVSRLWDGASREGGASASARSSKT